MTDHALESLRATRWAIGGYAVRFGQMSPMREYVQDGAFSRLVASRQNVYLLRDHEEGRLSLASRENGSLYLEQDPFGLWMEASLPDDSVGARVFDLVHRHAVTGVSPSWTVGPGDHYDVTICTGQVRVWTNIDAWEFSLVTSPTRPRFMRTWVRPSAEARRERYRYL